MKSFFATVIALAPSFLLHGQASYTGYIDKYPIEFVSNIYSDGEAKAFYAYSKFDNPIRINGALKGELLTLNEADSLGNTLATLTFKNFKTKDKNVEGIWKDLKTNKELKIKLTKSFDIDGDNNAWKSMELLQPVALKDKYFKLIIGRIKGEFYARVTGVKILEKGTDKLVQQINNLECQVWGLDNISVDDYNFDGIVDFSVFEQSYAGPNTSSIYFLYNSKTGKYFNSGFQGTSLEFDKKAKRIMEHNQCCAGLGQMTAEYKVVNNKMVLVKKTCFEMNEKTGDLKEIKCD